MGFNVNRKLFAIILYLQTQQYISLIATIAAAV